MRGGWLAGWAPASGQELALQGKSWRGSSSPPVHQDIISNGRVMLTPDHLHVTSALASTAGLLPATPDIVLPPPPPPPPAPDG